MNEDGIPDDIRSAAVAVVDRGYDEGLIDAVCRALMVERAWCLKIVEERCEGDMDLAAYLIRRGSNDPA